MNVPKLRFPEFEGEWQEKRLGSLVSSVSSGRSSHAEIGSLPVYGSTGQIGWAEGFDYEGPAILVARVGANAGKLNHVSGQYGVTDNTLILPVIDAADQRFVLAFLINANLNRFVFGSGQPLITGSLLKRLKGYFPSLPEQKKIAAFLGVVDAKIAALRARRDGLERYKGGLMQALFSQTLRFTKSDGTAFPDWEEKRLGEVATRSTLKNTRLEHMRVLTNSAVQGVVDQGAYFDKDIANAENLAGYYVLKKGDFVYNPRISYSAPVGPIKRNDLGDGVMSPLYTVYRFKQKDTTFYNVYFATTFWHKYMKSVANYGARHDRMAITANDFMNMPLPHPHPDEQRKIADALSAMDAKVAAVADQVAQMETFKKGLLQQMFV